MRVAPCPAVFLVVSLASIGFAAADCPPGVSVPITGGDVILTGLGGAPHASFFLLGQGDQHNSGSLTAADVLVPAGDVDGDGLPDWRVEGNWSDPRTLGCPALASPAYPPIVLIISHDREDLDGDGKFDVFEDRNHDGVIDNQETDFDGDGRATPPNGCEGVNREDKDCDGHLDFLNEDLNHNGILDPGEDLDGDGHLDDGTEDRNHNQRLDDRPDPAIDNGLIPDEHGNLNNFYPYGEAKPSPGGIIVISLAWNGTAYDLQDITTPTTIVGSHRLIHASPLTLAAVTASGSHESPPGWLRMRLDFGGLALNDDVGGTRAIFDAVQLWLTPPPFCAPCPFLSCGLCPVTVLPPGTSPMPPGFVESGGGVIELPSSGNLAAGAFLSLFPPGPLVVFPRSEGSDRFLAGRIPGLGTGNLLDLDGDRAPAPLDNCPDLNATSQVDTNRDGIGDACDPTALGQPVPDAWRPIGGAVTPGARERRRRGVRFRPQRGRPVRRGRGHGDLGIRRRVMAAPRSFTLSRGADRPSHGLRRRTSSRRPLRRPRGVRRTAAGGPVGIRRCFRGLAADCRALRAFATRSLRAGGGRAFLGAGAVRRARRDPGPERHLDLPGGFVEADPEPAIPLAARGHGDDLGRVPPGRRPVRRRRPSRGPAQRYVGVRRNGLATGRLSR